MWGWPRPKNEARIDVPNIKTCDDAGFVKGVQQSGILSRILDTKKRFSTKNRNLLSAKKDSKNASTQALTLGIDTVDLDEWNDLMRIIAPFGNNEHFQSMAGQRDLANSS